METKASIRKQIFARRKEMVETELLEKSRQIFANVRNTDLYREAKAVYAYMDFNREVMTREFIEKAWADGKQVAVPRVQGQEMTFYVLESFGQLAPGYFGIEEPVSGVTAAFEEALMIVPGVAFDRKRHRIGYGQGFYDRYLSVHRKHPAIAVAYEFQIWEEVPFEETDICPDLLITESHTYEPITKREEARWI